MKVPIDAFLRTPTQHTAADLVKHFRNEIAPELIAQLAHGLASSGCRLTFPHHHTIDLASTGGPSSLSTLICPLFLARDDRRVVKLGIQGRPAGGIDVMAQIPGFQISPSPQSIPRILDECGYAHFIAGDQYAPLDQKLFRWRQKMNCQGVPGLVVASILSKKLAVGVKQVGLDVRVSHFTNFGGNSDQAVTNARLFNDTASQLGINSKCILSDANVPYQPYIGRGEALLALHRLFEGGHDPWLVSHVEDCRAWSSSLVGPLPELPSLLKEARSLFSRHLESQGATYAAFEECIAKLTSSIRVQVLAPSEGFVRYSLPRIRDLLVTQSIKSTTDAFPDAGGVILLVPPEEIVAKHQPVLAIRGALAGDWNSSFEVTESPVIAARPQYI